MEKLSFLAAVFVCAFAAGQTADWPVEGGNPQRTGWQTRETILDAHSVNGMKLLWKRKLDSQLPGLSAPVILGRIITHHGFQELVFIGASGGKVFAIDADLNRVLWTRQLGVAPSETRNPKPACGEEPAAAPLFQPLPGGAADDDEDNPLAPRPVYVLSSDGVVYALNPMTGADMLASAKFLAPNARFSSLNVGGNFIYTTTSGSCGDTPDGIWSLRMKGSSPRTDSFPVAGMTSHSGVTVGPDGTVYAALARSRADTQNPALSNSIVALAPGSLKLRGYYTATKANQVPGPPIVFTWQTRELIAAVSGHQLFLLASKGLNAETSPHPLSVSDLPGTGVAGLATWETKDGERWLYAATTGGIVAFRIIGKAGRPSLKRAWNSHNLTAEASPVVANGVIYAIATGKITGEHASRLAHPVLYALDALSGKILYSSAEEVKSFTHSSGLAVANGHVCFGTGDNTLYCFGLPIDL